VASSRRRRQADRREIGRAHSLTLNTIWTLRSMLTDAMPRARHQATRGHTPAPIHFAGIRSASLLGSTSLQPARNAEAVASRRQLVARLAAATRSADLHQGFDGSASARHGSESSILYHSDFDPTR